jgi:hypothetical protein
MIIRTLLATAFVSLACVLAVGCADDTGTLKESADAAESGGYAAGQCETRIARAEAEARGSGRCQ